MVLLQENKKDKSQLEVGNTKFVFSFYQLDEIWWYDNQVKILAGNLLLIGLEINGLDIKEILKMNLYNVLNIHMDHMPISLQMSGSFDGNKRLKDRAPPSNIDA